TGDTVAMRPGRNRSMRMHHEEPAAQLVRHHHLMDDRDRNPRIVAETTHPAIARVQMLECPSLCRERRVHAVVVANSPPQSAVAGGCTVLLDPRMLIWRNGLVRELTAEPSGFLGEDDVPPET